jgi:hypothetical protein
MSQPHPPPQQRTRLQAVEVERRRDGTCEVRVVLLRPNGERSTGEAAAHDLPVGRMRAGAGAALEAIKRVLDPATTLQLRGVKAVKAFDEQVVVVAVRTNSPRGRHDLIGAVRAPEGDLTRGGSLAVLDALNRFIALELGAELADEVGGSGATDAPPSSPPD